VSCVFVTRSRPYIHERSNILNPYIIVTFSENLIVFTNIDKDKMITKRAGYKKLYRSILRENIDNSLLDLDTKN